MSQTFQPQVTKSLQLNLIDFNSTKCFLLPYCLIFYWFLFKCETRECKKILRILKHKYVVDDNTIFHQRKKKRWIYLFFVVQMNIFHGFVIVDFSKSNFSSFFFLFLSFFFLLLIFVFFVLLTHKNVRRLCAI